ncbi:MAG TPA: hypothetical protein VJ910_14085 [Desulfuromonadales bacterium]|nr:hypothetical protein [Desulfuromonadales bacterium]
MPIAPPPEEFLDQPEMELMDLFGRMRSLTDRAGFAGVLPAIWKCSDESQGIKKALYGYLFSCPAFNLGRVGALLDPSRLSTAAHHGKDLVILGGSHIGAREDQGIGYIRRVHGQVAPCCGMLHRVLSEYLDVHRKAAQLTKIFRDSEGPLIEIPYKYLFRKPIGDNVRIQLRLNRLVAGEALGEGTLGKVFRLNPELADLQKTHGELADDPRPIGPMLVPDCFHFVKQINHDSLDPRQMLEASLFDFLPGVVCSPRPHRRLCDVNTWRQFHRIAAYLTDILDTRDRHVLVIAGLTVDYSIRRSTFVPQFGFWMEQGQALQARYYGPADLAGLLNVQDVYRPTETFLEYAGIDKRT